MNKFYSIRFKLIALSIIIEVIMLSILILNANRLIVDNLKTQTYKQINTLKSNFQASILPLLIERDYGSLDSLLQEYIGNNNYKSIDEFYPQIINWMKNQT